MNLQMSCLWRIAFCISRKFTSGYSSCDDDVSKISDNEDFHEEESEDDRTVAQERESEGESKDYDVDGKEYDEEYKDDSAFSTKAGNKKNLVDLKKGGRKVRGESEINYEQRIKELEEQKRAVEEAMTSRISELSPVLLRRWTLSSIGWNPQKSKSQQ